MFKLGRARKKLQNNTILKKRGGGKKNAEIAINDAVQGKDVYIKSSESTGTTQEALNTGSHSVKHWNYKEDITTIFNPIDLTCEKCVVSTHCKKTKATMFGDQYCKEWEESLPKRCTTIEF